MDLFTLPPRSEHMDNPVGKGLARESLSKSFSQADMTNLEWSLSIPYPTSNSLQDLFLADKQQLKSIVDNNDALRAGIYARKVADQIAGYYYYKKNIDLRQHFSTEPTSVIIKERFA